MNAPSQDNVVTDRPSADARFRLTLLATLVLFILMATPNIAEWLESAQAEPTPYGLGDMPLCTAPRAITAAALSTPIRKASSRPPAPDVGADPGALRIGYAPAGRSRRDDPAERSIAGLPATRASVAAARSAAARLAGASLRAARQTPPATLDLARLARSGPARTVR